MEWMTPTDHKAAFMLRRYEDAVREFIEWLKTARKSINDEIVRQDASIKASPMTDDFKWKTYGFINDAKRVDFGLQWAEEYIQTILSRHNLTLDDEYRKFKRGEE